MFYIKLVFFLHLTEYILNKNGNELKLYLLKIIKKKSFMLLFFNYVSQGIFYDDSVM